MTKPDNDGLTAEEIRLTYEQVFRRGPITLLVSRADDGVILFAQDPQGILPENIVGTTTVEAGVWPDNINRDDFMAKVKGSEGSFRRENWVDANGKTRVQYRFSHVFEIRGHDVFAGGAIDIDELTEAEDRLEDATARLKAAQSIAQVGDFVWHVRRNEFSGSTECYRLLGIGPQTNALTIEQALANIHVDDLPAVSEMLGQANSLTDTATFEHRVLLPNGEIRDLHVTATSQPEIADPVIRGTVQNITDRKRAEQERERLSSRMQESQKLESLGLLAGGVAHDFNNLLSGIMGNADLALMDPADTLAVTERLNDIVQASKRAAELTRQLLAYSGKGRYVVRPIDLSGLVREMMQLLEVSITGNTILNPALADDLPAVEADETQIRQVVMNLIINAAEAIEHDEGRVGIATGIQYCDQEYLQRLWLHTDCQPGSYVFVEVSDNGSGMDAETKSHVFEPFFTTKVFGRGLGMAAVLGIVTGHGGAISIYTEVGDGTTFKILLPASSAGAEDLLTRRDSKFVPGEGRGVLVIDDEPTVRDLACRMLERYGYTTFVASSGSEGLELFKSRLQDIALVLLDLNMPGMGGEQTFRHLRQVRPGVKTILMSGYNEQDATQRFVGKGLAGFLAKPFMVEDLMACVDAAFGAAE